MASHKIVLLADPVLRQKAEPVTDIDEDIRQLLDDMVETMYDAVGIGLAAPQIGISKRLIVMDCAKDDSPPEIWKMINPEIINRSEDTAKMEEGCLSIPGYNGDVIRPAEVEVRYIDIEGNVQQMTASGLLAACVQHEIDHLDGVLFIDHLSRLKRDMILRKVAKDPVYKQA